jgi:Resolvase, N terminal domain
MHKIATAIGYVRVSTSAQGRFDQGLEAQRAAIARFAEAEGLDVTQVYEEIETGSGADAFGPPAAACRSTQDRSQSKVSRSGRQTQPTIARRSLHLWSDVPSRGARRL